MNKGLFALVCLVSCLSLLSLGCANQQSAAPLATAPVEPLPPAAEPATTPAQMARVQNIMNEPKPAGEFTTGADVLSKNPAVRPAKSAARPAAVSAKASAKPSAKLAAKPPAKPATVAKIKAASSASLAKASPKSSSKSVPLASKTPAKSTSAKAGHVAHGSVLAKAGSVGSGTVTVNLDTAGKPKTSYAVTASTYFEKVIEGGKFGKDLHLRGSWSDLASGKRVWFTYSAADDKRTKPTLASVATFIRPRTREEYEQYEKQLSHRHTTSRKT